MPRTTHCPLLPQHLLWPLLAALALLAVGAGPAWCAEEAAPAPLASWDFEEGVLPWIALDPQVHLEQTTTPGDFHSGAAALEVQYEFPGTAQPQAAPQGPAVVLPQAFPQLAAVRFAIKTSQPANLACAFMEENRSVYLAFFYCNGGSWQTVELGLSDFMMLDDANTPRDPNGQLDPDQITGLGVMDLTSFLAGMAQAIPLPALAPGPRRMWLDDVQLLSVAPPAEAVPAGPDTAAAVILDGCDRPTFRFLVIGGKNVAIRPVPGGEEDPGAYEVTYTLPTQTVFAVGKGVAPGALGGTQALHLSVASKRAFTLFISVEQKDKQRFNWTVDLPGGEGVDELSPPWDAFDAENADREMPARVDPERITLITIADLSNLNVPDAAETTNTLRLDNLYASK